MQFECGTRILRVIHGRDARATSRTGELLLYTDPILVGDPTTAVNRLRSALENGFKKLPAGS
jgi:hypothetical protein